MRLFLVPVALATLLVLSLDLSAALAQTLPAPVATPQWEIDAGGKMAFDVASVKQNTSGKGLALSFLLDNGDAYPGNMTLFSASFPLATFIGFAYRLPQFELQELQSQLPKWASTERFDIEARAAVPSTKDQMRLMMQSLLADRFKLGLHFETNEKPIFNLVLVSPGKMGPQLRPYASDPPCSTTAAPLTPNTPGFSMTVGSFPPTCYSLVAFMRYTNGGRQITWGSRNVSMRQIADDIDGSPRVLLGRPVVDQTGLSGNFDFVVNFGEPSPARFDASGLEDSGPSFLEALQDQLGLKLESATGMVESVILDHIEEPSPN